MGYINGAWGLLPGKCLGVLPSVLGGYHVSNPVLQHAQHASYPFELLLQPQNHVWLCFLQINCLVSIKYSLNLPFFFFIKEGSKYQGLLLTWWIRDCSLWFLRNHEYQGWAEASRMQTRLLGYHSVSYLAILSLIP